MNVGDLVTRKSHNHDIVLKITRIEGNMCYLKGLAYRIICDSPLNDLELATKERLDLEETGNRRYEAKIKKPNIKYLSGKILHIDGDENLLNKCLDLYKRFSIYAKGVYLDEKDIGDNILDLIEKYRPDILVITGHDAYNKKGVKNLDNYLNSKHFVDSIVKVREKYKSKDLVIIAGACQSHFEALIASGADFATSPQRVNVHTFDPAIIAIITSLTPFNEIVDFKLILRYSSNLEKGVGGLETYGKMRLLL